MISTTSNPSFLPWLCGSSVSNQSKRSNDDKFSSFEYITDTDDGGGDDVGIDEVLASEGGLLFESVVTHDEEEEEDDDGHSCAVDGVGSGTR